MVSSAIGGEFVRLTTENPYKFLDLRVGKDLPFTTFRSGIQFMRHTSAQDCARTAEMRGHSSPRTTLSILSATYRRLREFRPAIDMRPLLVR
jgi:hypothetical protein